MKSSLNFQDVEIQIDENFNTINLNFIIGMNIYRERERERQSFEYHNSYNNFGNEDDIELVMVMDSIMMLVVKVVVKAMEKPIDAN